MKKLTVLVGLMMALALALPGGANAASFSEVKKLTASDAQADDRFGYSTAISGDTAIVGAHTEDAEAVGAGAAYIFERFQGGPGNWGETIKLTASDPYFNGLFGISVAISGDTAIVGAIGNDTGDTDAGVAYILQRNQGGPGNWGEVKKLVASDAQADDAFGRSVAISGDTAIVSARQSSFSQGPGVAYVFERDQGGPDNWGEVKKLTASDAQISDSFAFSVAISGNTAVVGAPGVNSVGVETGAAYIFERDQGGFDNWGEVKKLAASDAQTSALFGWSVAINEDTAVFGAWGEDAGGTFRAGAAYIFERDQDGPASWGEVKKLTASDAQILVQFGWSVAISGNAAIVGATFENAGGSHAGAAYHFERDQGGPDNWGEMKKLTASDAQANDEFGFSVGVSGDTAIVGARYEDAGGTDAGAAYVFDEHPEKVGGLVVDLDEGPLASAQSSGGSAGRLAGTIAGVVALAVTLTGAAWYARRRWR